MKTLLAYLLLISITAISCGILDPRHAKRRETLSLDTLWNFTLGDTGVTELMPVPASYNDITTDIGIRDYAGVVKYHRRFSLPESWATKRIWLRFGSVTYAAEVYINGKLAVSHEIGHLPFVAEITSLVTLGDFDNDIEVLVDNTLTDTTIPQGSTKTVTGGRVKVSYSFDFFHYAGIDRPVILYATEKTYIDDISLQSKLNGTSATVTYDVTVEGTTRFTHEISILDKLGNQVASNNGNLLSGDLEIPNVNLWWPYLMSDDPGYLYVFKVDLYDSDSNLLDRYELPFGVRELAWDSTSFKINGKPIYLRGFGRHEDSDIHGRGLDLSVVLRDYSLIKWIGANSYRTSHYPYAEEIMDLADMYGIMIIDEVPAVNINGFSDTLLENHKRSITELIARDKNRPSVVMWSAANEPSSQNNGAEAYFRKVIAHLKSIDKSRPVTIANLQGPSKDQSAQFLDIVAFNEYSAWYSNEGDLEVIVPEVLQEAQEFHDKHNKPVMVTEYGADTLEGFHILPNYIWSEEYQNILMSRNFNAFDQLRAKGWFIGEMIWNFADFKTKQEFRRVGGNKKGIFTRQRQPKQSAHHMRRRYWALAGLLDNATLPDDLDDYIAANPTEAKDEL